MTDSRDVYCSSSRGDDAASGTSRASPKRSLAAAVQLLRTGHPDRLLLHSGDVWTESLGQWKRSGLSVEEPMVIGAYGVAPDRPMLLTGGGDGFFTSGGGGSPATVDYVSIVGLHFKASGYAGGGDCVGIRLLQPGIGITIEDCKVEGYSHNLILQGYGGRHRNLRVRRCVIIDAYAIHAIGGHSQGLYAYGIDGLEITDCVFDHNGWRESVPGAHADIYSHNLYVDNGNTGVTVRGNIISRASSHGLQLRCGGAVEGNLFVRNPIACSVGGGNAPEPSGVVCRVIGNVILEGTNISPQLPRGFGLWFANIESGEVTGNIIANNTEGAQPEPLTLDGQHKGDTRPSIGVHRLALSSNIIHNWGGSLEQRGDAQQISGVSFAHNDFDGSGSYSDPDRSIADWNAAIDGTRSFDAFISAARAQSAATWSPGHTAAKANRFIRAGFLKT